MQLIRRDSNPNPNPDEYPQEHRQEEFRLEKLEDSDPEAWRLRVNFPRFGLGSQRRPSFAAEMSWTDVQGFVKAFIELQHPEAMDLMKIIDLARTIEAMGWELDVGRSQEFWDIVPR